MAETKLKPGRKIDLDDDIYCRATTSFTGGDKNCDHDYNEKPDVDEPEYAKWKCTRCGGIIGVDVWD